MDDIDKHEAELLARLEAEHERRLAERIEAGEIVSVPLFIVAGSHAAARIRVEEAKADKLAELRGAGDQREVKFYTNVVITGVVQHGEAPDPASAPSAPSFSSPEDVAHVRHLPSLPPTCRTPSRAPDEVIEDEVRAEPEPVIETYIVVQTRRCVDAEDPGEVSEGWYSIDGKVLTVTDAKGRYVGSRTMLKGEDARVVAKQLLREKITPTEDFQRRLSYPNVGLA